MNNLAWKLFFSAVKFKFRSFQFYRCLQPVFFYIKVFVPCILDFLLHDVTQREVDNNKRLTTSFFFEYLTCATYLVLCCKMIGKSMSLTMQKLSKRSETYQVWAITNWLYIEMQGLIID